MITVIPEPEEYSDEALEDWYLRTCTFYGRHAWWFDWVAIAAIITVLFCLLRWVTR